MGGPLAALQCPMDGAGGGIFAGEEEPGGGGHVRRQPGEDAGLLAELGEADAVGGDVAQLREVFAREPGGDVLATAADQLVIAELWNPEESGREQVLTRRGISRREVGKLDGMIDEGAGIGVEKQAWSVVKTFLGGEVEAGSSDR